MTGFIKSVFGSKDTPAQSANPAYLDAAGEDVYNRGTAVADKPYQPYGGGRVSDLSANQQDAIGNAKNNVGRFDNSYGVITNYLNGSATPYDRTFSPNDVSGNRFDNYDISGYIDPYVKSVLDPQLADLREQGAIDTNALNARAGNSGNFGGSRQALSEDLLARRNDKNIANATNNAYSQAFNNAQNMFNLDENRAVDTSKFNANQASDAFKTNYGIFADNATRNQQAASGLNNLINTQRGVTTDVNNDLLKTGALEQGNNQANLDLGYQNFLDQRDYDKNMTSFLSDLLKQNVSAGKVTPGKEGDNGVGNAIGTAIQIASAFAGSDVRIKTHAIKVGEKDGISIYEFNYTDKPERYRGVMAQDVMHVPGAVIEEDGILKVDYSKLPIEFERIAA